MRGDSSPGSSYSALHSKQLLKKVPFDGDTAACTKLVKEDARPKISLGEEENNQFYCTAPIANIIRKCWVSDAFERPNFNWVIEQLN